MKRLTKTVCLILLSLALEPAYAVDVQELQKDWAHANYQLEGEEQVSGFETLVAKAEAAVAADPGNPELLIWQGIIQSTYAGKAGGLSALSLVKAARDSLEKAMEIDPMAMQGSAYTSLGALYYQVPGWPIAFGSDKKARKFLEKALSMNPDGIDSNYFYGDFLYQQKDFSAAKTALKKALAAPARPGREVADSGRREEIKALLMKIDAA